MKNFQAIIFKQILLFGLACSLKLEINWKLYDTCHIIVARAIPPKNIRRNIDYIESKILSSLITSNQHERFTWQIKDVTRKLAGMFHFVDDGGIQLLSDSYSTEKFANRKVETTCSIILTSAAQISTHRLSTKHYNQDQDYIVMWGFWLSYIRNFRKSSLFLPSKTTVVLALAIKEDILWHLASNKHEAMLMAPYLNFLLSHHLTGAGPTIENVFWACNFCNTEFTLFHQMQLFAGLLNQTIFYSFLNNPLSKMHNTIFRGHPLFSKSLLNTVIHTEAARELGMKPRMPCHYNQNSQLTKLFWGKLEPQQAPECRKPSAVVTEVFSRQINFTNLYGSVIDNFFETVYFSAVLILFEVNRDQVDMFHPEVDSMILWDSNFIKAAYCEDRISGPFVQKGKKNSIFLVIGSPFDLYTWICISVFIFALLFYFRKETRPTKAHTNKWSDCIIEILQLLLQRSFRKLETVRVLCLVCCFFLEFFYLTATTEEIISPLKPYLCGTVTELLTNGFKFYQDAINPNVQDPEFHLNYSRSLLSNQLSAALRQEGFSVNLLAEKNSFFWPALNPLSYPNNITDEIDYRTKHWKTIETYLVSSINNYRGSSLCVTSHRCARLGIKCHYVSKLYGGNFQVFHLYSKIRNQLEQVLGLILYESGIRMYWSNMHRNWDDNLQNTKAMDVIEEKMVATIRVDDALTLAIFKLWFLMLVCASLVYFATERQDIIKRILLLLKTLLTILKVYVAYYSRKTIEYITITCLLSGTPVINLAANHIH